MTTSAGVWGALPQAEGVAHLAEQTAEKAEGYLPQNLQDRLHSKDQSGFSTDTDTSSDLEKIGSTEGVAKLARKLTHQSLHVPGDDNKLGRTQTENSIKTEGGGYRNSFIDTSDPALDPGSGQFRPEVWVRTLIGLQSRDPDRYPQRVAGIAYKNLSVHGFGSLTDYQKYVQLIISQMSPADNYLQNLWKLPSRDRCYLQQTHRPRENQDTDPARL